MRPWPIVVGAACGLWARRLPGLVLGAGIGWNLALLLELRERLARLERRRTRHLHRDHRPPAAAEPAPAGERYPEREMVAALQEGDPEEMADLYAEVSGQRDERH